MCLRKLSYSNEKNSLVVQRHWYIMSGKKDPSNHYGCNCVTVQRDMPLYKLRIRLRKVMILLKYTIGLDTILYGCRDVQ